MNPSKRRRRPGAIAPAALVAALAVLATASTAGSLDQHPRAAARIDARLGQMAQDLGLSADQQREVRAVIDAEHQRRDQERGQLRARIDAILTPAQRANWDQRRTAQQGQRLGWIADRLGLSGRQRTEVERIIAERKGDPSLGREEVRARIDAVLTETQRAEFAELRQRRGQQTQGPPSGPD